MNNRKRPRTNASITRQIEKWNAANPVGTEVVVTRDDGSEHLTVTTSEAWSLGFTPVVKLADGVPPGGYALDRVRLPIWAKS